jgi:YfiH family protein
MLMPGRLLKTGTPAWIKPVWPAPDHVLALSTTRPGGYSTGHYAGMNLGDHVGDEPVAVSKNRQLLAEQLQLPGGPVWLKQVHGNTVVCAHQAEVNTMADAAWTDRPGSVCAVLTADCLPLLFCDRDGRHVAVAHAGWRGLAAGVIEATLDALPVPSADLLVWLGPAISAPVFEVGENVVTAFTRTGPVASQAFTPAGDGKWFADLPLLASLRLQGRGVVDIYRSGLCTFTDSERFYSFRRDGATGRTATLIMIRG